jgi:hypothetical protein
MRKRKIIFFSEDEELYKSFNRAFAALLGIEVIKFKKGFGREMDFILYCLNNCSKDFGNWFCGVFRKKSRNPLIVVGVMDKKSFIQENPVFIGHPYNHIYISLPFRLQEFIDNLVKIIPIYDEDTRKFIIKDYCKNYEYTLVTHELKIMSNDKKKTLNNFSIVKDFYKGEGNSNKVKFLTEIMQKIKENSDWLNITVKAKQTLVNDVEKRKTND